MNLPAFFPICFWILGGLLLGGFLLWLRRISFGRIAWNPEAFPESTEPLSNPYQGFYHIFRYTLSRDHTSFNISPVLPDSYSAPLALLEINLKQFRTCPVNETGLQQLDRILTDWSRSPYRTKLILRFLYDWDGLALATEPSSLELIMTHMDQICPVVNRHSSEVYLLQGIFIGNWGEMHHSLFEDQASMERLLRHLHECLAPSIFLSVRTPAQWRMVNHVHKLPARFPAFGVEGSLMARLGLFNDGILGSESDLGTYGNTARLDSTVPSAPGTREEELAFQNDLCRYVPNGGEVVYHQALSRLETSVSSLRAMHVSYLNADYDSRVLEAWRNTVWTANDAFQGCDGYRYVEAHLGYRYLIRTCGVRKTGLRKPKITVSLTLQNTGFSNTLKPFQAFLLLKHMETGACTRIPFQMDLRKLYSGQTRTYSLRILKKELAHGSYQLYFSLMEESSGQQILLGNTNEQTEHGYLLGQLEN